PRRQRPPRRTMLVLVAVSSINTSRVVSRYPCSRIQRRRARATSARCCSVARKLFFKRDAVTIEKPPHRATATRNPSLAHGGDNLIQGSVRLLGNDCGDGRRSPNIGWGPWLLAGHATPFHRSHVFKFSRSRRRG